MKTRFKKERGHLSVKKYNAKFKEVYKACTINKRKANGAEAGARAGGCHKSTWLKAILYFRYEDYVVVVLVPLLEPW